MGNLKIYGLIISCICTQACIFDNMARGKKTDENGSAISGKVDSMSWLEFSNAGSNWKYNSRSGYSNLNHAGMDSVSAAVFDLVSEKNSIYRYIRFDTGMVISHYQNLTTYENFYDTIPYADTTELFSPAFDLKDTLKNMNTISIETPPFKFKGNIPIADTTITVVYGNDSDHDSYSFIKSGDTLRINIIKGDFKGPGKKELIYIKNRGLVKYSEQQSSFMGGGKWSYLDLIE